MEQNAFDNSSILGARLSRLTRGDLTALCEALCEILARTDGYHGGVRPGNISYAGADAVALGNKARAGTRDWSTEELEFMAPEVFWSGELAPSADVYSIGLLLYAGVSGGKLPFYPQEHEPMPNDRAAALRRRMNGEELRMPKGAGKKLAEIIRKATQYRAEDRYPTPEALCAALRQYRAEMKNSAPTAQEMFEKPEQELSDVERMMLGILGANAAADEPEEEPEAAAPAGEAPKAEEPAPEEAPQPEVPEAVGEPQPKEEAQPEPPAVQEEPPVQPVPEQEPAPSEPEPEPKDDWKGKEVHQKPKKNNHKGGIIAALAICAVVLAVLILRSLGVFGSAKPAPTPTPEPTPSAEVTPTPTPEPTPTPTPEPKVSTYEIVVSDASWEAAEADAQAKGGHLAVIDDEDEFQRVAALAGEQGVRYVWIGLYRTDSGELAWVHSTESGYYNWAEGEPSVHDTNGAAEDYVLLSNRDGTWYYNDCIGDPAGSYPRFYSGQLAYVIEYEG